MAVVAGSPMNEERQGGIAQRTSHEIASPRFRPRANGPPVKSRISMAGFRPAVDPSAPAPVGPARGLAIIKHQ